MHKHLVRACRLVAVCIAVHRPPAADLGVGGVVPEGTGPQRDLQTTSPTDGLTSISLRTTCVTHQTVTMPLPPAVIYTYLCLRCEEWASSSPLGFEF